MLYNAVSCGLYINKFEWQAIEYMNRCRLTISVLRQIHVTGIRIHECGPEAIGPVVFADAGSSVKRLVLLEQNLIGKWVTTIQSA